MILRGRRSVHRDDRGDATGCQPGCDSRVSVRTQSNQCFRRAEMRIDEGKIEKDVASAGGRFEWLSDVGAGMSFPPETTDDHVCHLGESIRAAVWISLKDTLVTDRTLSLLEGAPVLEAVDLTGTSITYIGVRKLLETTPTIYELTVSGSHIGIAELAHMRKKWPKVQIVER